MKIIINEAQARAIMSEGRREINQKANEADRFPTEGQKKAGNYKMGHLTFGGFKITIENPKGSKRTYTCPNGRKGFNLMKNHYGYFSNTMGHDGDQIDVFLGPCEDFQRVYVVDQNGKEGDFDESKVMLGFESKAEAKKAYMSNFSKGWDGFRSITGVDKELFKKWLYDGHKQRKPFSEYVGVKAGEVNEAKKAKGKEKKTGLQKFLDKHGIEELSHSLGWSEKEQKYYGWSHRAIYGFGIGSKVKKGDCAYNGKEWTAKNLSDAKKMAEDFAESVA